jgi:membrane-bound serine protease (ClpP class)
MDRPFPKHHTAGSRLAAVLFLSLALAGCGHRSPTSAGENGPGAAGGDRTVVVGTVDGAIGPVTKDYIHRVIQSAGHIHAQCVVLLMDTPGGLDASMRDIIKDMLASPVPVVVYVYPGGSRAASAGAIITLASDVAAMAPRTNIGAAHPVSLGQGNTDEEMMKKVTNDAAAFARGLAKERGRNVEWAEKVVRESISSTAEEALDDGVIDLIANDVPDLLQKLDGRSVTLDDGMKHTLATAGATRIDEPPSFREKVLARIADPNIAYLLMLAGIFGIFFELQNPGAIFPGVIGGIAILLAFFALQVLPVNYVGVALILLAVVMFLLEVKIPSGGLLTVGGVIAMLIGSIMFIDSPLPFMRVSLSIIVPSVIFTALFFLFAVGMGIRAQRRKVATGYHGIVGEIGTARSDIGESGSVFVHGEHWNARSDVPIPKGARVQVVSAERMILTVRPYSN